MCATGDNVQNLSGALGVNDGNMMVHLERRFRMALCRFALRGIPGASRTWAWEFSDGGVVASVIYGKVVGTKPIWACDDYRGGARPVRCSSMALRWGSS